MTDTLDRHTDRRRHGRTDLHVCADTTPGAHRTDSDDIYWWLPIIGPTATVLAQTLARHTPTGGATWDTGELAQRSACPATGPSCGSASNRLDRSASPTSTPPTSLTIRLWLPALSPRQLDRLPADMAAAYRTDHPSSTG